MVTNDEDVIWGRVSMPKPIGNSEEALWSEQRQVQDNLDNDLVQLRNGMMDAWEREAKKRSAGLEQ